MKKLLYLLVTSPLLGALLLACEPPKKTEKAPQKTVEEKGETPLAPPDALAKVGDIYISRNDLDLQLKKYPPQLSTTEHGRKYILNQLIDDLLIKKEAENRNLHKDPEIVRKIEDYAYRLYKEEIMANLGKREISNEEAESYFEAHKEQLVQPDKVRISLIEVALDDEKTINEVYNQLKAGKDFGELAQKYSKHNLSAKRGGDIGFVAANNFKHLSDVAFKLKIGTYSKPFKSAFGWHIVKATEFRKGEEITKEEGIRRAKAQINALEASRTFDEMMKNLKERYKIEVYEEKLKQFAPPKKEEPTTTP
ncbi:MAG: peptidyl-prolyl cis-trans isomerase [Myxococcota bacterium]